MDSAMIPVKGCSFPSIESDSSMRIDELRDVLEAIPAEFHVHLEPIVELFPGGRAQAICIPAGTCLVGKRHKHPHLVIVLGDISVQDEAGRISRLQGFRMFTSSGGFKRAGFAHADTIFINVHSTALTGGDDSEEAIVEPDSRSKQAIEVDL